MKRLSRYLLQECTLWAVGALLILSTLVLLPQALRLADLWVNKGVPVSVLGWMVLLLIPKLLVGSLPMALLLGILMVLGRMSEESEIVVLKASGVSMAQMLLPVAVLVTVFAAFSLALNFYAVPASRYAFFQMKEALVSASPLTIKAQTFNQSVEGLTFYINQQEPNAQSFHGILIHDEREKESPVTLMAKSGQLRTTPEGHAVFLLNQGSRYLKKPGGGYQQLHFATYSLELGISLGLRMEETDKRLEDYSPAELWQQRLHHDADAARMANMEWHRRLSYSAATFILGMLAIPLGIQHHRGGRAYGFVVAVTILTVHLLLLSLGGALVKKGSVDPALGYWMPNLFMALLTLYVIVLTARERPFPLTVWLVHLLSRLPQRLLRPQGKEPHAPGGPAASRFPGEA